jgi:hypothetical protein
MPSNASSQSVVTATLASSAPALPASPVKTRALRTKPAPEAAVKVPTKTDPKRGSKPPDRNAAIATKRAPISSKTAVKAPAKPIVNREIAKVGEKSVGVGKSAPVADKTHAHKREKPKSGNAKAAHHRAPKIKMVRDSFTFPETEHKRMVQMKKRLIALGTEVKKGELVRAGLELLASLDNQKLLKAVAAVDRLKTGRPKK